MRDSLGRVQDLGLHRQETDEQSRVLRLLDVPELVLHLQEHVNISNRSNSCEQKSRIRSDQKRLKSVKYSVV
jgi:hypothetical protein